MSTCFSNRLFNGNIFNKFFINPHFNIFIYLYILIYLYFNIFNIFYINRHFIFWILSRHGFKRIKFQFFGVFFRKRTQTIEPALAIWQNERAIFLFKAQGAQTNCLCMACAHLHFYRECMEFTEWFVELRKMVQNIKWCKSFLPFV